MYEDLESLEWYMKKELTFNDFKSREKWILKSVIQIKTQADKASSVVLPTWEIIPIRKTVGIIYLVGLRGSEGLFFAYSFLMIWYDVFFSFL
jgi:hypothetical protein